jgi:hypothetical protein
LKQNPEEAPMSETIQITLPDAIAADVDAFSTVDGVSTEDLIRAVEPYLSDRRFLELQARIGAQAKENGFHTDKDVFRAVS